MQPQANKRSHVDEQRLGSDRKCKNQRSEFHKSVISHIFSEDGDEEGQVWLDPGAPMAIPMSTPDSEDTLVHCTPTIQPTLVKEEPEELTLDAVTVTPAGGKDLLKGVWKRDAELMTWHRRAHNNNSQSGKTAEVIQVEDTDGETDEGDEVDQLDSTTPTAENREKRACRDTPIPPAFLPRGPIGTNEQRVKEEVICKKLTVLRMADYIKDHGRVGFFADQKDELDILWTQVKSISDRAHKRGSWTKEEQEDYRRYRQQIVQIDPVFKQWTPQRPSGYDADFCTLFPDRGVCLDPSIRPGGFPYLHEQEYFRVLKDVVDNAFLGEQPKRQEVIRVFIRRFYQDCHLAVQGGKLAIRHYNDVETFVPEWYEVLVTKIKLVWADEGAWQIRSLTDTVLALVTAVERIDNSRVHRIDPLDARREALQMKDGCQLLIIETYALVDVWFKCAKKSMLIHVQGGTCVDEARKSLIERTKVASLDEVIDEEGTN